MSWSVLRRSSRASSSAEIWGSGMPACAASRSTASGNGTPSVNITKSKIEPFLPEEKSNHAIFWSLTKNDGVFSLLKGESPFHSRPAFLSFTRRPTTSETGSRARSSSRNCGEKRIGRNLLIRGTVQYRPPPDRHQAEAVCPGYPQGGPATMEGGQKGPRLRAAPTRTAINSDDVDAWARRCNLRVASACAWIARAHPTTLPKLWAPRLRGTPASSLATLLAPNFKKHTGRSP